MLIKEAKIITGGLSQTSKMPCPSWSIPPNLCKTGNLYSTYKNSVCSQCYAKKGYSYYPVVQNARARRFHLWQQASLIGQWTPAMVRLIKRHPYFRWFDAGDLYNKAMLMDIIDVCISTPHTQHWLPTLERALVLQHHGPLPSNLCIRFSSPFINTHSASHRFPTSMVSETKNTCHAIKTSTSCEHCRDCWDKNIKIITYGKH